MPTSSKAFSLLEYKAYYGLPLAIPGMVTRQALFLLDENHPTIESQAKEKVRIAGDFVRVALERATILNYMHRYERRYSKVKQVPGTS
jgi:hypothetical protein